MTRAQLKRVFLLAGLLVLALSGLPRLASAGSAATQKPVPPAAEQAFTIAALKLEMMWIEPGEFLLGSPGTESSRGTDEGPQTRVMLTRGYWIGKTEVTQAQWQTVMQTNPSRFRAPSLPVEQVSWTDAMEFSRRVTEREGTAGRLPTGYVYSLPTEAQWEYAAKAGSTGAFAGNLDDVAWHDQNSGPTTRPVGTKQPNAWGLYDTLGNVWEWCADWYGAYPGGTVTDYAGAATGTAKASRGGSWWAGPRGARPANRYRDMPQNGNDDLGFRLALIPSGVVRGGNLNRALSVPGPALTGKLSLAGTESMAPMVRRWIELFRAAQPGVEFQFEIGAPPTAAAGLAAGTAHIGYTGRTLWESEIAAIVKARGHAPRSFRIGAGAFDDKSATHTMAVFVHAENPLARLTLTQVREVFSGNGRGVTWGQLGAAGEWSNRPVHGLVAKLGTGATNFVKEHALHGTAWVKTAREFPTDEAAIAALAVDRFGLCIAGLPYDTPGVRPLALSAERDGAFFEPSRENVILRRYPLARLLYFHVVETPAEPLGPVARGFIRLVLSEAGQAIALEAGYLPLTTEIARDELKSLE